MRRHALWVVGLGVSWLALQGCGSDDDSGLKGSGGGNTGGSATGGTSGGGGSGGANTGGAAGTAGTATGGSAGTATGGSAGMATGGSAGSGGGTGGGTGGGNTGGADAGGGGTGGSAAGCPTSAPAQDSPCTTPGTVCCYGAAPEKPVRCVPTAVDGGGPYHWATLQSKVCCPASAPNLGQQCNAPGDLKCCYGSSGYFCDNQPNPDVWASGTCG